MHESLNVSFCCANNRITKILAQVKSYLYQPFDEFWFRFLKMSKDALQPNGRLHMTEVVNKNVFVETIEKGTEVAAAVGIRRTLKVQNILILKLRFLLQLIICLCLRFSA